MKIDEYSVSLIKHLRTFRSLKAAETMAKDRDLGPDPPMQSKQQQSTPTETNEYQANVKDRKPDGKEGQHHHEGRDKHEGQDKHERKQTNKKEHQTFRMTANQVVHHIPSTTFSPWDRITIYFLGQAPNNGEN